MKQKNASFSIFKLTHPAHMTRMLPVLRKVVAILMINLHGFGLEIFVLFCFCYRCCQGRKTQVVFVGPGVPTGWPGTQETSPQRFSRVSNCNLATCCSLCLKAAISVGPTLLTLKSRDRAVRCTSVDSPFPSASHPSGPTSLYPKFRERVVSCRHLPSPSPSTWHPSSSTSLKFKSSERDVSFGSLPSRYPSASHPFGASPFFLTNFVASQNQGEDSQLSELA